MSPLVQRSRSSTARTTPYGAGQLIQFQCDAPDAFSFTTSPTSQPSISPPSPGTFEVINLNSPDSEPSSPESNYSAESPPSIPADDTSSLADGEGGQRTTSSRGRPADHIRRPRNAFMIFRSDFWAKQKINKGVETDHRHISRIIGHCWNELPEDEKLKWRVKADLEKLDHEKRYPNYRFTPTPRAQKPIKRKVQRNGTKDMLRCRNVAKLLLAGKQGDELETAVIVLDTTADVDEKISAPPAPPPRPASVPLREPAITGWKPARGQSEITSIPSYNPFPPAAPAVVPCINVPDRSSLPSEAFYPVQAAFVTDVYPPVACYTSAISYGTPIYGSDLEFQPLPTGPYQNSIPDWYANFFPTAALVDVGTPWNPDWYPQQY